MILTRQNEIENLKIILNSLKNGMEERMGE